MINQKLSFKESVNEEYKILTQLEEIFIKKRGYAFKMPSPGSSVILLLSGGLDSICLWNILMSKYRLHVYPIFVVFHNHKLSKQKNSINLFSKIFKEKYPKLFHDVFSIKKIEFFSFQSIKDQSMVFMDLETIFSNLWYEKNEKMNYPVFISTPQRIGHLAFFAYEYAHKLKFEKGIDVNTIFTGIMPEDKIRGSTLAVLRSINLSFSLITGNFKWLFTAPIEKKTDFFYKRIDLVKNALKNKLPVELTWSCSFSDLHHCGKCQNCKSRMTVFKELCITDKTIQNGLHVRIKEYVKKKIIKLLFILNKITDFYVKRLPGDSEILNGSISINNSTRWQQFNKSIYLLNKKTGDIKTLNGTASIIWQKIAHYKLITFNELLHFMIKKYKNINKVNLQADLLNFIKQSYKDNYLKIT